MLKITKVLINFFFYLILISSCIYSSLYYLGFPIKEGLLPNIINLILSSAIFLIGCINLNYNKKILRFQPLILFLILISTGSILSIFLNKPEEYLPSIIRFFGYPFTAFLGYCFIRDYGIMEFRQKLVKFLRLAIFLIILFGFLEIVLDDVVFLNGAYRFSGPFKHHQLGFALYTFVIIVLFNSIYRFSLVKITISLILLFLFLGTHSRALMIILIISYLSLYFGKIKNLYKAFIYSLCGFIIIYSFYYGVVNSEYFPRLKVIFTGENFLNDSSTLERIEIITNSLRNVHGLESIFGIGLGGFNEFYYKITGRTGVAAHNNYLLFFIETGIFGLSLYILFQFLFFIKLFLSSRKNNTWLLNSALVLFLGIEILSFLQNNYYFYASEHLVWLIIGASIYQMNKNPKRKQDVTYN